MNGSGGDSTDAGWLLALHSSSGELGVGVLPWRGAPAGGAPVPGASGPLQLPQARLEAFATGRDLSNRLLCCIESVLPAREWPRLRRLAVATGPGGFTSTRLTLVLARTLAQQRGLPLDGVSSFLLIARRLWRERGQPQTPFWLVQELPRRGPVAGLYGPDPASPDRLVEREAPRLHRELADLPGQRLPAEPRLPEDVGELLAISHEAALRGAPAPWQAVVPLYPTSPVRQA